jgi:hypothetical protein
MHEPSARTVVHRCHYAQIATDLTVVPDGVKLNPVRLAGRPGYINPLSSTDKRRQGTMGPRSQADQSVSRQLLSLSPIHVINTTATQKCRTRSVAPSGRRRNAERAHRHGDTDRPLRHGRLRLGRPYPATGLAVATDATT